MTPQEQHPPQVGDHSGRHQELVMVLDGRKDLEAFTFLSQQVSHRYLGAGKSKNSHK